MPRLPKACRAGISPYISLPVSPSPQHRQRMTQARLDVVGIGNAIVDVIAHADDAFLAREGLVKGTMTLVDAPRVVGPPSKETLQGALKDVLRAAASA